MIETIFPEIFDTIGVVAGFTTRHGGVSDKPYDSLNFGYQSGDARSSVEQNHSILYASIEAESENVAFMNQVHSATVALVDSAGVSMETDGIVSTRPGLLLGVKCADCIPLLLADEGGNVVAAVHCGWRPLVAGIVERAIPMITALSGKPASKIHAAIGPAAGPCCYEIGPDVADRLHRESVIERDGSLYGDLRQELRLRLNKLGVFSDTIETVEQCTICNPDKYYSYRRDGAESGRMLGFIQSKG